MADEAISYDFQGGPHRPVEYPSKQNPFQVKGDQNTDASTELPLKAISLSKYYYIIENHICKQMMFSIYKSDHLVYNMYIQGAKHLLVDLSTWSIRLLHFELTLVHMRFSVLVWT